MAPPQSTDAFSELLNPIKDPERSFNINISELLENYIRSFVDGSVNFNSAALMIQGSSSIYGKKVEYLHNLVTKLYESMQKNKKDDGTKKEAKEKEKHTKESKFADPFCSTEIKLGKNLSCLKKKFSAKNASNKKASKKSDTKYTYAPVDLVPIEEADPENTRGEMEIKNTEGTVVGKKSNYTLNKCKITSSGWILLPTTSPDLIPSKSSSTDYTLEEEDVDDNMCCDSDSHLPDSSPLDEGFPQSTGCTNTPDPTPQSSQEVPASQETDEGLGSLPCTPLEGDSQPVASTPADDDNTPIVDVTPAGTSMEGNPGTDVLEGDENIPLEDADVAPAPRRSTRHALKLCQLQEGETTPNQPGRNSSAASEKEVAVVKRAIQKKSTYNLPRKLKASDAIPLNPAAEFCARTFFSLDRSYSKYQHCLGVPSFRINPRICKKFNVITSRTTDFKEKKRLKALAGTNNNNDESEDVDIEGIEEMDDGIEENLDEPATNDAIESSPLEAADIVIENNPVSPGRVSDNENPLAENEPVFAVGNQPENIIAEDIVDNLEEFNIDDLDSNFEEAARLQCDLFREDLLQYAQTSDLSERVHAWEATMGPYLEELNRREEFDIDLYGSRILNAFQDSNRKQTITFRNFCKGKEKWEIHRYFMALLPLVNIGNVSIESEKINDDEEDILVTLLSRRMHHRELEEFGHNEGEHS